MSECPVQTVAKPKACYFQQLIGKICTAFTADFRWMENKLGCKVDLEVKKKQTAKNSTVFVVAECKLFSREDTAPYANHGVASETWQPSVTFFPFSINICMKNKLLLSQICKCHLCGFF